MKKKRSLTVTLRLALAGCTVALLTVGPALGQYNALDRERGAVVRERGELREQIRRAVFQQQYALALELCDELEQIDPASGFLTHYRGRAEIGLARQGENPAPVAETSTAVAAPTTESVDPFAQPIPVTNPRGAAAPSVATAPQPVAAPAQPAPVESPAPAPRDAFTEPGTAPAPQVTAPPSPGPAAVSQPIGGTTADRNDSAVSRADNTLAIVGGVVAAFVVVGLIAFFLVRRRVRALSRAKRRPLGDQDTEDESLTDEQPVEVQVSMTPIHETYADATELVTNHIAPWKTVDEAVSAIREKMLRPPEKKPVAPEEGLTPEPISLDREVGPSSLDVFGTSEPKSPRPVPEAMTARAALNLDDDEQRPESIDADKMRFREPGSTRGSQSAVESPEALRLDLGVDNGGEDASAPAPAAESRSEMVTPVPEMDDDDLDLAFGVGEASPRESERRSDKATASLDTGDLRIPSVPPSPPRITIPPIKPEIPPRETTAPPLNLDDLLGSGDQIAPEKSTLSTPPSPSGANPLRLSLGPPPPDDRDETPPGLSVTDLEETQTLSIPAAGGTQRRSVNDTQELDPREIDEVLSNIELEDETVTLHRDAADEDRDSRFLALCREGREASESGDWDEAVKIYRQALQVRPDSAEARHRLRTAEEAMQGTADATPSSPRTPGL